MKGRLEMHVLIQVFYLLNNLFIFVKDVCEGKCYECLLLGEVVSDFCLVKRC